MYILLFAVQIPKMLFPVQIPKSMLIWLMIVWLYRFLDSQKNTRSQFSVPGLRGIHKNLKENKNFNSRGSFFRKSPFSTFACINPGSCGPWDNLWILFLIAIFKRMLLAKKFLNFMQRFKSAILASFQFWQNGTFETLHEIQKFFCPKEALRRWHLQKKYC